MDRGGVWGHILTKLYFVGVSRIFGLKQRGQPYCYSGMAHKLLISFYVQFFYDISLLF